MSNTLSIYSWGVRVGCAAGVWCWGVLSFVYNCQCGVFCVDCAVLRRRLRRLAATLGDEQPILVVDDDAVDYSRTISLDRHYGRRSTKRNKNRNVTSQHQQTHTHTHLCNMHAHTDRHTQTDTRTHTHHCVHLSYSWHAAVPQCSSGELPGACP